MGNPDKNNQVPDSTQRNATQSDDPGLEVQCGKGMGFGIEGETPVSLVVMLEDMSVELEEVSMSATIDSIIVKVLTKMVEMLDITGYDYTRVGDPQLLALEISSKNEAKTSSKMTISSEDQTQTLAEFLSAAGYYYSSSSSSSSEDDDSKSLSSSLFSDDDDDDDSKSMSPIHLYMIPNWYRYVKKDKTNMREERERADDSDSDEDPDIDLDNISDKQRPAVLVEDKDVLRVFGRLQVYVQHQNDTGRSVGYLGGLRCKPKDVVKFTTPAKRVLLVFTSRNLELLQYYYKSLDSDFTINPNDEVLILLVTWDKFSYWFLRMLRKSIGSQVPIVAFTDSDVHQLDLLTFLDTPPQKVSEYYGWDDCVDLGVGLVDVVNIKWAGVRPSDNDSPSAGVRPILNYDKICDFLEQQEKWPLEVQLFKQFRFYKKCLGALRSKSRPRPDPLGCFIWNEYIPKKLEKEDWI